MYRELERKDADFFRRQDRELDNFERRLDLGKDDLYQDWRGRVMTSIGE